jgi:hypothetical protein
MKLGEHLYKQQGEPQTADMPEGEHEPHMTDKDHVMDAEFTEVNEDEHKAANG